MADFENKSKSIIKIQLKIIVIMFSLFALGVITFFVQGVKHSKRLLLEYYSNSVIQQATLLDNSIGSITDHVYIMKSLAESGLNSILTEEYRDNIIRTSQAITDYDSLKDYTQYKNKSILNNHKLEATIAGKILLNIFSFHLNYNRFRRVIRHFMIM